MKPLLRISILKTLVLSARYRGRILICRGTRIHIARGAKIQMEPGSRLILGQKSVSATPSSLTMRKGACFTVKGEARMARGTRILIGDGARLEIGDGFFANFDATIICWDRITIGIDAGLSWNSHILDGNAHEIIIGGVPRPRTRPITIGDRGWVGAGAVVVGASIGGGSVVAAGSVVSHDVPAKVLVGGNPARVVKEDVEWVL
jgi:acetyltransferase-like isoleucine patch superfamily enzyme